MKELVAMIEDVILHLEVFEEGREVRDMARLHTEQCTVHTVLH